MTAWLRRAWQFLREVSGEAALERRLQACGCAKAALAGEADKPRCC
ncbi:MAG: hypothetical protein JWM80_6321 [Cyanobacteria bacterium RYN_339]|nr:hypothetical protein [Cyanobacteria bacterium RYN_339]